METPPITVVILAAGLGTRMKSKKAKVLHRAGGATLLEHVVNTALTVAPPERVYAVIGHQADQVRAELQGTGIQFLRQEEQKGTGHALLCCRKEIERHQGLLLVLYGDCPLLRHSTLQRLIEQQQCSYGAGTVITTLLDNPTGYGRVVLDTEGNICAIVEEKAASDEQRLICEINSGIYCLRSELLWKHIDEIHPNPASGEYYLTDIIEIFSQHGYTVSTLRLADPNEVLGINTRIELATVDRIFRERKVQELMLEGVTIERPETVTIDARVRVGMDTVIEAFSQLLGNTSVGEDCRIGAGSIIRDSDLADKVEVAPYTLIGTSRIETGARIGPFARLRADNHVGPDAQIGNFVELKKARVGAGSKAMHLAYLGDAVIGEGSNIGAGTITCNYNGARKHETRIGDHSFVGSNSTLVAPLEIGAGSYIGAGSVITAPVPPGSLALGRSRQVVKEGWAEKRQMEKEPVK